MKIPTTTGRQSLNTNDKVNDEIRTKAMANVALRGGSGPDIGCRLGELDREWDIERVLMTNAGTVGLLSVLLGAASSRKWFALTGLVSGFLIQHAVQGWCPPLPLFRKLGIRTAREIEHERNALKALRGDFRDVETPDEAFTAAEKS